ncbi:hypothetical protein [Chryseobacterium sp. OSA05B]|uniref:hypothetical protein n=1 Tax=Chryseobacterium sp. OSA05B TaxID=2862650 RepID=UPI001CC0B46A|nr:hypothetical protein [Chryseobacterium sp. OSA05B]
MVENFQYIDSLLYSILPFSLGAAFIGLILSLVTRVLKNDTVRIIGIALFIQCFAFVIILIVLQSFIIKEIRSNIKGILADHETKLFINSDDFGSIPPKKLKKELLKLTDISTNHSHPENIKTIQVTATSGDFNLFIGKDSNDPKEFWIFTDKYGLDMETEIGKIKTSRIKLENPMKSMKKR